MHSRARAVLQYWIGVEPSVLVQDKTAFNPERKRVWFMGGKVVDDEVKATFLPDIQAIGEGAYDPSLEGNNAHEAVAGLILMDQMTRNAYRGTAAMYSLDARAVMRAKQLVETGAGQTSLALVERLWVYMPFMHASSWWIRRQGCGICGAGGGCEGGGGHGDDRACGFGRWVRGEASGCGRQVGAVPAPQRSSGQAEHS